MQAQRIALSGNLVPCLSILRARNLHEDLCRILRSRANSPERSSPNAAEAAPFWRRGVPAVSHASRMPIICLPPAPPAQRAQRSVGFLPPASLPPSPPTEWPRAYSGPRGVPERLRVLSSCGPLIEIKSLFQSSVSHARLVPATVSGFATCMAVLFSHQGYVGRSLSIMMLQRSTVVALWSAVALLVGPPSQPVIQP